MASKSGPTWGLIGAIMLLICCLGAFAWSLNLHLDPLKAAAFADGQVRASGIDWSRNDSGDDGHGRFWFLYQNPADRDQYARIEVRRGADDEWIVVKLDEDFRPWQAVVDSR